jgi:hypothetical protein
MPKASAKNERVTQKTKTARVASSPPSTREYTRVETRWHEESRELQDLTDLAERIKGNPTRRGEAAQHLINMWSRVLHGELSPSAFWELFGVSMSALQFTPGGVPPYPTMPYPVSGMYPTFPGMLSPGSIEMQQGIPQQPELPSEDPKVKAKRERVTKNQTQANVWAS